MPRAVRGTIAFEDCPVERGARIAVDTSLVFGVLSRSEPRHADCVAFFERLSASGAVVAYSELLNLELLEACYKAVAAEAAQARGMRPQGRRAWAEFRGDGRAMRRAGQVAEAFRQGWSELLGTVHAERFTIAQVIDTAPSFARFGLQSYDAAHAATASYADAAYLATLDQDFSSVPANALRVCVPASMVTSFRANRRRSRPSRYVQGHGQEVAQA